MKIISPGGNLIRVNNLKPPIMRFSFGQKLMRKINIAALILVLSIASLSMLSAFKPDGKAFKVSTSSFGLQKNKVEKKSYPPDNVNFHTMLMEKRFVDHFLNDVQGFTHFIFQVQNSSSNPSRDAYELVLFYYWSLGQSGPESSYLTTSGTPTAIEGDVALATYTRLKSEQIRDLIPTGVIYTHLKFEPTLIPGSKYIGYKVYPVDSNGNAVRNAKNTDKSTAFDKVQPFMLNPSPPATSD